MLGEATVRAPTSMLSRWRSTAPRDVIAGLSVAMVGIPQSLAYAELAGMPPVVGLYSGALPPVLAALFASSPYLQTGPVAITALLTFGALSTLASPGSPEYVTLGITLAAIVGVFRVLLGLFRAGWLAYLMSQPMLLGFIPAAGILIAGSQLPKTLGGESPPLGNEIVEAAWVLVHPGSWEAHAIIASVLVASLILGGRKLHPLVPGVLVAVVLAVALSTSGVYTSDTVGDIPTGFPPFTLTSIQLSAVATLILPGAVIALVGFTEAASISRRFAAEDRTNWDANREFLSQGAANVGAALFGGMPCGGSFSRSSVNRMSGATTRFSGAVTGLTVLAFLPFASVLEPLPTAVLGTIVVLAVVKLIRFGSLVRLWRVSARQAVVAWGTFAATVLLAPRLDLAVLAGVGLSFAVFLTCSLRLGVEVSSRSTTLTVVPRGTLWFGTAHMLESALADALTGHPDVDRLVIDLGRLGHVDTTGALILREACSRVRDAGMRVELCDSPGQSRDLIRRIMGEDGGRLQ